MNSRRWSVAVIGSINRDTVRFPDGHSVTGFGGTLYNLFGLHRLLGDRVYLSPVCNLGSDVEADVRRKLSYIEGIDTSHVRIVQSQNNHCEMEYDASGHRRERFTGFVPAISYTQIEPLLDSDLVLVNFISGRDISLKTLEAVSIASRGTVYIDLHTLMLGLRRDGTRYYRKPRGWREFSVCADYLQMNAAEFETLSEERITVESIQRFYREYLYGEVHAVIVTLGAMGAMLARRRQNEIQVLQR